MDHDQSFKQLLATFFREFVDLFLPQVAAYLDADAQFSPLEQEIFLDLATGERREVDLVMRARFRGDQDGFFLIHVENQATPQVDFPERMFSYFALLTRKYHLPVYPVVIFSYDSPHRAEPDRYTVAFPDKTVLRFEYTVIQLNRLPWRRFIKNANPVATALMAKMKIAPKDRPKVKLECLRLLGTMRLEPAHSALIATFVDQYLQLSGEEMKQFERGVARLPSDEKEKAMDFISRWEQKGLDEGLRKGKEGLVMRQIRRRLGLPSELTTQRLEMLSAEQLDNLGEALLEFRSLAELDQWLSQYGSPA